MAKKLIHMKLDSAVAVYEDPVDSGIWKADIVDSGPLGGTWTQTNNVSTFAGFAAGQYGNALLLPGNQVRRPLRSPGTSDYLNLTPFNWTIWAWVYVSGLTQSGFPAHIFHKNWRNDTSWSSPWQAMGIQQFANTRRFELVATNINTNGLVSTVVPAANESPLNTWEMWAATFNGSTRVLKMYINGVKVQEVTLGGPTGYGQSSGVGGKFVIGSLEDASGAIEPFNGRIDDCRFYDGDMSGEEILQAYNNTAASLFIKDVAHQFDRNALQAVFSDAADGYQALLTSSYTIPGLTVADVVRRSNSRYDLYCRETAATGHTLDANTQALWRFSEATDANLVDAAGNEVDLTQTGGTIESENGLFGTSRVFGTRSVNGLQYFTGASTAAARTALQGDMTVEAWIFVRGDAYLFGNGTHSNIFVLGAGNVAGDLRLCSLWIERSTGKLHFSWTPNTNNFQGVNSAGAVPTDQWVHVAASRQIQGTQSIITFYINGVRSSVHHSGSIPGASTGAWFIGRDAASSSGFFAGRMDDMRISKVVRTADEVYASWKLGVVSRGTTRTLTTATTIRHGLELTPQSIATNGNELTFRQPGDQQTVEELDFVGAYGQITTRNLRELQASVPVGGTMCVDTAEVPTLSVSGVTATTVTVSSSLQILNTGIVGVSGTYSINGPTTVSVSSVAVGGSSVVLTVSGEMRQGATYTLQIPGSAMFTVAGVPNAAVGLTFTGSGTAPGIATLQAVDTTTLRVIFSEAVNETDALTAANYVITTPNLAVTAVRKETDRVYLLTTGKQTPGQNYTLTISNIRDTSGNTI